MSNYEKCGYYSDGECNICGMGMSGEDTFCRFCKDNPNCYYKQILKLKAENEKLKECNEELTSDNLNTIQEMDNERRRVEQLKAEIIELEEKFLTINGKSYSYYTILKEIKAIVKNICDGCTSDCDCDEDCNYFLITEQLTKAEGEE